MLAGMPAPAAPALDDDARYAALARRDESLRDAFVVGVLTTGIYCRPGCPARTPRRENVRFFADTAAARAAGLRPCRRCRPDEAAPGAEAVARACRLIEAAETAPALAELAAAAGLSPHHFHRLFKARVGVTPAAYARQVRDRRAKAALAAGARVVEAVYDAGYGAPSRFYHRAHARFGMTPRAWRDGGAGVRIAVTIAPCALGQVLVAATARGLCAVELGDDPVLMRERFARRFARAELVWDDPDLAGLVARVVAQVEDPARPCADLPLDVRGTAFQQRVWEALRRIPPGETWTYARLAAEVGAPKAARAVGAACGANPVCVVVPCHRVVGAGGRLTGYAWGVGRKRALLDRERDLPHLHGEERSGRRP